MSDKTKNSLSIATIKSSDTISQFMEKCNNNFSAIVGKGGGPAGERGEQGEQGVPTKPKVPIHVWKEGDGFQYKGESDTPNGGYEIDNYFEDLTDVKYQEGHLIMLQNAHVYILESNGGILKPVFLLALQSYNQGEVIDGKSAYVHIAYANDSYGNGFVTDEQLRGETNTEPVATYGLRRSVATYSATNISDMPYMGIYTSNSNIPSSSPSTYTWIKVQGPAGPQGLQGIEGPQGPQGVEGPEFTGQQYTIDMDGDMSSISIDIDGTKLYTDDYCECIIHAYYGANNVLLNVNEVEISITDGYISNGNVFLNSDYANKIGTISILQRGNDVAIRFIPEENFVFPQEPIIFSVHITTSIVDTDSTNKEKTYNFNRKCVWSVKGILSTFELNIIPQYRTIKLFEDGRYYPEKLSVSVYKTIDGTRKIFDFSDNSNFTLLYKNYNDNNWAPYPDGGVSTIETSCLEFKVVKNYGSTDPESPEEIWDYEDVWVVADGESTHYYHADLGNTESMMVLTTGVKKTIETENGPQDCAELKNENGYSITFNPKFYDGTNEFTITKLEIGTNSGEEYYQNGEGSFMRELNGNTFTINRVPYGVDMIPMSFDVYAKDSSGVEHRDSIAFNVYISTISNIYTLVPTATAYNTSTGKTGDTIGCAVYKNNIAISILDLDQNALELKYIVHDGGTDIKEPINYTEPLVYGNDDDVVKDEFTASDIAISFILYYRNEEIVRSTVSLIKDGIDGKDGESWQYIFCRSNIYPFNETHIDYPSEWDGNNSTNPDDKLYFDPWTDDHQGVDESHRYEYQSYRKWDKTNGCWSTYGEPTLYSNYSENGSGYNVILSNPIAVIPVGNDNWKVNENDSSQFDSTFVYLYNNTTDISTNNSKVSISLPEDDIYVKNGHFNKTLENGILKVEFIPVVGDSIFEFEANSQYKLPITITYNLGKDVDGNDKDDIFTATINWILTPIKGIENIEVFVDKRVVNTSIAERHSIRVGYYTVSSNSQKKFIGDYNDEDNITNGYKIILTDDIDNLPSNNIVTNWSNAEYDFVINGQNRNCYVVLVKSDEKTIIDYTNITSINDGKSAIHLELSQDYIGIPCDNKGNIHAKYDDIKSQMILYNGDKEITNGISYQFKIGDIDITSNVDIDSDGKFHIQKNNIKDIIKGDANIECIAIYNNSTFRKTLHIDFKLSPFELEFDKNILSRDVNIGKITDKYLLSRVKYWDTENGKWVYTTDGEVVLNGVNGQENLTFKQIDGTNDRKLIIETSYLATNTVDTEFRVSYYLNGEELTYENIGVINSGENGSAPSCTNVEILGYSLDENANINDVGAWVSLIDLGTVDAGQPIYILNKYTWSDGEETNVKTVTLAGTQGVDGKSRVLFYLGSFEDGTLTKSPFEAILDDDRCDYYIDINGYAWMRTGTNRVSEGFDKGMRNNPDWKEANKVGFLQTGAIHADMINTQTITSDSGIVTKLFSQEIVSKNLTVDAAQITGTLDANEVNITNLTVDAAQITGTLDANEVNITNLTVDAAQITGTLDAQKINTDGLTVNMLNTNPKGSGDIIQISDNHIYCFATNGDKNLIISSDNIDSGIIGGILANSSNGADSATFLNNITLKSGTYGEYIYTNDKEWYSSVDNSGVSKVNSIGYCINGASLSIKISVRAYTSSSTNYNPLVSTSTILAANWNICGNVNIYLYKKNIDGTWSLKDKISSPATKTQYGLTINNWIDTGAALGTNYMYKQHNELSYLITNPGEYGLKISFDANALQFKSSAKSLYGGYDIEISNNTAPSTYTEIGKDGIVVYDGMNALKLDSAGVEMRARKTENGSSFYGWKVTSSGIYYCNGGTTWTQWSPSTTTS